MPTDYLGSLTAGMTIPGASTANLTGTGIDMGAAGSIVPRYGLVARVAISDAHNGSGSNTLDFTMEGSHDNSNWVTVGGPTGGTADQLTLSTSVQSKEVFIPFETPLRYIRLKGTVGGAGTGTSVTLTAHLAPSYP